MAEELDGGVRNLVKYTKLYSYSEPTFNDGLVFTAFVGEGLLGNGLGQLGHDGTS